MAGHTFISHASADASIASKVCTALESRGLSCWMAPRDVPPGGEYADALVSAIKASDGMVVIFTARANESPHVMREVERAITYRVPVLPLRIDGTLPSGSMEYLLGTPHWLEASENPDERALDKLGTALRGLPIQAAPMATRPLGLLGAACLQCAVAMHAAVTGTLLLVAMTVAPPSMRDAAFALLPYCALALAMAAGLIANAAGLLLRRGWARSGSLLLNLVNVPFQLLWSAAVVEVFETSPLSSGFQLFALLISLALVTYLFQPQVRRYFVASTA